MKKGKKILLISLISVVGLAGAGVGFYFLAVVNRKPEETIYDYTSNVKFNYDSSLFSIDSNLIEGNVGDNCIFEVKVKNENKYYLKSVLINNKYYLPNSDNYFTFELIEGENTIKLNSGLVSEKSGSGNSLMQVNVSFASLVNGKSSLVEKTYKLNTHLEFSITPNNGYKIKDVSLNNGFYLPKNKSGNYEFTTFKLNSYDILKTNNVINVNFVSLSSNSDDVFDKFDAYIADKDIKELDFSSINDFSLAEYFRIGINRAATSSNYLVKNYNEAVSNAKIVTNTQTTVTGFIKNNENLMKEVISYSSNAQYASRIHNYSKNSNQIDVYFNYRSNVKSATECDFSKYNKEEVMTYDTYKNTYYINPFDLVNYLVYDSYVEEKVTIDKEEFVTSLVKENDEYILTLALKVDASKNYANYMTTTTSYEGASVLIQQIGAPIFDSLAVKIKLNNEFYPITMISRESYKIQSKLGANIPTIGYGKSMFYYTENDILSLDTNLDYTDIYQNKSFD